MWFDQWLHWLHARITCDALQKALPYARHQLAYEAKAQAPLFVVWLSIADMFQQKENVFLYVPNILLVLLMFAYWIAQWLNARNQHAWAVDYCKAYNERIVALEMAPIFQNINVYKEALS